MSSVQNFAVFAFYKIFLSEIHLHGTCFRMYLILMLYMVMLSGFVHILGYAIYKYVAETFLVVFILDFIFKFNSIVTKCQFVFSRQNNVLVVTLSEQVHLAKLAKNVVT